MPNLLTKVFYTSNRFICGATNIASTFAIITSVNALVIAVEKITEPSSQADIDSLWESFSKSADEPFNDISNKQVSSFVGES